MGGDPAVHAAGAGEERLSRGLGRGPSLRPVVGENAVFLKNFVVKAEVGRRQRRKFRLGIVQQRPPADGEGYQIAQGSTLGGEEGGRCADRSGI